INSVFELIGSIVLLYLDFLCFCVLRRNLITRAIFCLCCCHIHLPKQQSLRHLRLYQKPYFIAFFAWLLQICPQVQMHHVLFICSSILLMEPAIKTIIESDIGHIMRD
ncbi:hypothetical protein ACJX0J_030236, partial [Zea mays]